MARKDGKWVGFQASPEEQRILKDYCAKVQMSQTTVLRLLIKTLEQK